MYRVHSEEFRDHPNELPRLTWRHLIPTSLYEVKTTTACLQRLFPGSYMILIMTRLLVERVLVYPAVIFCSTDREAETYTDIQK